MQALWSISFRPFFLLAALMAALNPILWVGSLLGHLSLPLETSIAFWHGHEMTFGFSGALVAGFILTASANWTRGTPYQGRPIIFLVTLWLIERVSFFLPLNEGVAFVFMNLFFPALGVMLFLKLKNFPKQRNVFIPILLLITLGKLLYTAGYFFDNSSYEIAGRELATGFIRFILLLIAGRIVPFFTRKRLADLNISVPAKVNILALVPLILLALPLKELLPLPLFTLLYIWAIVAGLVRQGMWLPHKTLKVPMLIILHIGVSFIYLGLIFDLAALYTPEIASSKVALHALMAGGLATVGIGIMTRVSLGHTGRLIQADGGIKLLYLFIVLGALVRILLPFFPVDYYTSSLYISAGLWCSGFFLFFLLFYKKLAGPRPDSKAF